ncbi:YbjN domain-containing protein [Amycolatopsis tolypomycina]|uniref:Putative sensory transduction regulator n=1 Tax=Amycolatopsis tolypomycina TaxID=208445 RepID=A0A1H4ZF76_9PSEU|nr:YbjN domain-containing protein [Amycolatopsis tolypomycina]SED28743.1 Putative sensory transduction regulator [Amycolatopsis tolypomycina]
MSATEAVETAELLTRAREALERYLEVHVDDDGALTFSHGGVPCVIQATRLGEGLTVLTLTCVVGWDLADAPALSIAVAERAGQGLFGTLGVGHSDNGADVTLRYAFPAAGLDAAALGTLLMLVVSTASQLRTDLPGIVPGD